MSRRMRSAIAIIPRSKSPMTCSAPMATTTEAQPMLARATAAAHWSARTAACGSWRVRHLGDMAVLTPCIQAYGLESPTTSTGSRRRPACSQCPLFPLQLLPRLLSHLLQPQGPGWSLEMVARLMASASKATTIRQSMATTRPAPSASGMSPSQLKHSPRRVGTIS